MVAMVRNCLIAAKNSRALNSTNLIFLQNIFKNYRLIVIRNI